MNTSKAQTFILTIAATACLALAGCNGNTEQAQKEPPKVRDMNDGQFLGFSSKNIYPHYATEEEKKANKAAQQK